MECISCETSIVIDYSNLSIREIIPTNQIYCEVEGRLTISIGNECIFSEEDILLLEFAKQLNDWLKNPYLIFSYYSMDYEEGPIIYFEHEASETCAVGGVWLDFIYTGVEASGLIKACKLFIEKIISDLSSRGVDIISF